MWRRVPWRTIRAVGVFAIIAGGWFCAIQIGLLHHYVWAPFTGLVADCSGLIFKIFGAQVHAAGTTLSVNGTSLGIEFGCNGLEAHGILFAAVLASAMTWKRKLTGLAIGFVVIFLINQIRLCGLFIAAWSSPSLFEYCHTVIGQTFVIVGTMAFFLWWDSRDESNRKRKPKTVPA
jgi:exosortase/archaeosortase family protein